MSPYIQDLISAASSGLPWDDLSHKNILVAGATGLIGACLVRLLMYGTKGDSQIYALCRNSSRAEHIFSEFAEKDCFHIFVQDITKPIISDIQFDYIIDAASAASPSLYVSNPVSVIRGNVYGVDNLLSYGILNNMKRFLYVSSGEIYGEGNGTAFQERDSGYVDCLSPRSCYPSSKRAAETLASAFAAQYGADICIARPCHVYGPEFQDEDNRVYAEFLRNSVAGKDIVLKSSGEQYRSWCYVVDCALALLYILLKGTCGEAYNVADASSNVTIKELAETVSSFSSSRVQAQAPTAKEFSGFNPVKKAVFSDAKLRSLGWSPRYDMKTSLEHCFLHLKGISV